MGVVFIQWGTWGGPYQTERAGPVIRTPRPRTRSATGYGPKVPTDITFGYRGRKRRVYAACYGNAATLFAVIDGAEVVVSVDE